MSGGGLPPCGRRGFQGNRRFISGKKYGRVPPRGTGSFPGGRKGTKSPLKGTSASPLENPPGVPCHAPPVTGAPNGYTSWGLNSGCGAPNSCRRTAIKKRPPFGGRFSVCSCRVGHTGEGGSPSAREAHALWPVQTRGQLRSGAATDVRLQSSFSMMRSPLGDRRMMRPSSLEELLRARSSSSSSSSRWRSSRSSAPIASQ